MRNAGRASEDSSRIGNPESKCGPHIDQSKCMSLKWESHTKKRGLKQGRLERG